MEQDKILRCKMRVNRVIQNMDQDGKPDSETVELQAVYGREGTKNQEWSKYTPNANFSITISNPAAFNKLSKGAFYFVDFVPAGLDD